MKQLLPRRLTAQQISRCRFDSPRALVAWLGAVQAQDYAGCKWALGLRLGVSERAIDEALASGAVIRTHAMRGTWQLVAPEDLRWLVGLFAAPLIAANARRYRELELEEKTLRKGVEVIGKALRKGEHLTRAELSAALVKAGISTEGQRMPYLLQRAELEALICSGVQRGKQLTWALVEERAPAARRTLTRGEALAELARRFFQSRGPATLDDFRWWSGLKLADLRVGLDAVADDLVCEDERYWSTGEAAARMRSPTAHLLPAFDEYFIGYRDRSAMISEDHLAMLDPRGGVLDPCVVIEGRVVGTWKRTLAKTNVTIRLKLFERLSAQQQKAVEDAGRRYGTFLGLEPRLPE